MLLNSQEDCKKSEKKTTGFHQNFSYLYIIFKMNL